MKPSEIKLNVVICHEEEAMYYVDIALEDGTNCEHHLLNLLNDDETVGSVIDEYLKQFL